MSPDAQSQLVDIEIEMPHNGLAPLKHPRARTGLEGKFSGPYCAAAAWIDGAAKLTSFTDAAVARPRLQQQMARVVMRERSAAGESLDTAPVVATVRGEGWTERVNVDWATGSLADPMTREQMERKWRDCVRHANWTSHRRSSCWTHRWTPAADLLEPLRARLLAAVTASWSARVAGDRPQP